MRRQINPVSETPGDDDVEECGLEGTLPTSAGMAPPEIHLGEKLYKGREFTQSFAFLSTFFLSLMI